MNDSHKDRRECLPESLWEAYEAGFTAGVEAEHVRILSVHKASLEGHEALTKKMMLDGHTTEGEAAMAVIAAEREAMDKARQAGAERQVAKLRENWESDASLRDRFRNNFQRYRAYMKNTTFIVVGRH